jgi:succinate dehydrogenase / fumarate reductase iron-sulfur subunit
MTRLSDLPLEKGVTIEPMQTFPVQKDLVTDVSWNYRVKEKIQKFTQRSPDHEDGTWKIDTMDTERVQEFRKCIECYICQDVCHVLREHKLFDEFIGPRFFTYTAGMEMQPLDTEKRTKELKDEYGIGYCNITKCCTTVCPEGILITDNAIIPLKERVADDFYDPLKKLIRVFKKE